MNFYEIVSLGLFVVWSATVCCAVVCVFFEDEGTAAKYLIAQVLFVLLLYAFVGIFGG